MELQVVSPDIGWLVCRLMERVAVFVQQVIQGFSQ
jgi:hypothetical protein